jgi:hypothetical protein
MAQFQTVEEYVQSLRSEGVDVQGIDAPYYLAMHMACQKVLQKMHYPLDSLYLQKAEDGPFHYLVDTKWDSQKAIELACRKPAYQRPIMKIRGSERDALEKRIDHDLTVETCGWM